MTTVVKDCSMGGVRLDRVLICRIEFTVPYTTMACRIVAHACEVARLAYGVSSRAGHRAQAMNG